MPTLETIYGHAVAVDPEQVNREFSRAMAADPGPAEQAPPKRSATSADLRESDAPKPKQNWG